MDFAFSEEQNMLREQVRSFLAKGFPSERVAEIADAEGETTLKDLAWGDLAGLGLLGLSSPEESGGAGMSFLEEAVVFEETGYALYPGPYFSTVGLAIPALERDPSLLAKVVAGDVSATLAFAEPGGDPRLGTGAQPTTKAEVSGDAVRLTGTKHLVPDLGEANVVVVTAAIDGGTALVAVDLADATGLTVKRSTTMDPTRPLSVLELDGATGTLLAGPQDSAEVLSRIRIRALAALALESVGIAQKMLDLANAHAKERKQFDKPIGTYQAVSHQIADSYVATELARSLSYWAAWSVAEDEGAELAALTAKAFASEAAVLACERCIQVHGGIGFTWEHIAHRYYKRAQWIESFDGYPAQQRAALADHLLA